METLRAWKTDKEVKWEWGILDWCQ